MPEELFSAEENEVVRQRKEKLLRLKSEEGYDPYVNETWDRETTLEEIRSKFDYLQPEQEAKENVIKTAGRVECNYISSLIQLARKSTTS